MGRVLVAWLTDMKWEVYQEVQPYSHGQIADIVAVRPPLVWIIEMKKSLTLSVIEQAEGWTHDCHYLSIAVRWGISGRKVAGRSVAVRMLSLLGIGILDVDARHADYYGPSVREKLEPKLRRWANVKKVRDCLTENHKTFAPAGNPWGKRLTPFSVTCLRVMEAVKNHPGITMKEVVDRIDTHYSSTATARASLMKWIRLGLVDGVRAENGRPTKLYPTERARREGSA